MRLSIFFALLLLTIGQPVLAENPINALSVSVPPKPLTLKPNATEGYAQKMRSPKLIEIDMSQKQQISPPANNFRETETVAKPLSKLFSTPNPKNF